LRQAAHATDPIKLGILEDQSGDLRWLPSEGARYPARHRSTRPAALPGASELVIYTVGQHALPGIHARVLQRDKVSVVFAGFSSASREGIDRGSARRLRVLQ
jgi:branched-chain amino acid transport system substrate-binding protein